MSITPEPIQDCSTVGIVKAEKVASVERNAETMNDRIPAFNRKSRSTWCGLRTWTKRYSRARRRYQLSPPELTPGCHDSTCCLQQILFPHLFHHPGNRAPIDIE